MLFSGSIDRRMRLNWYTGWIIPVLMWKSVVRDNLIESYMTKLIALCSVFQDHSFLDIEITSGILQVIIFLLCYTARLLLLYCINLFRSITNVFSPCTLYDLSHLQDTFVVYEASFRNIVHTASSNFVRCSANMKNSSGNQKEKIIRTWKTAICETENFKQLISFSVA